MIFIAGNIPKVSEIAPLMIMTKLEQYQYAQATAIAVVMLLASFALMFGINALQLWAQRRGAHVSRAMIGAASRFPRSSDATCCWASRCCTWSALVALPLVVVFVEAFAAGVLPLPRARCSIPTRSRRCA